MSEHRCSSACADDPSCPVIRAYDAAFGPDDLLVPKASMTPVNAPTDPKEGS